MTRFDHNGSSGRCSSTSTETTAVAQDSVVAREQAVIVQVLACRVASCRHRWPCCGLVGPSGPRNQRLGSPCRRPLRLRAARRLQIAARTTGKATARGPSIPPQPHCSLGCSRLFAAQGWPRRGGCGRRLQRTRGPRNFGCCGGHVRRAQRWLANTFLDGTSPS